MKRVMTPLALLSLMMLGACNPPVAAKDGAKPADQKLAPTPEKPQVFAAPTEGTGPKYVLRLKDVKVGDTWNYTYVVKTFADPKNLKTTDKNLQNIKEYMEATVVGTVEVKVKEIKNGQWTFTKTNKVSSAKGTGLWKQQADEMLKGKPDVADYTWDERLTNVNIDKQAYVDPMTNSMHTLFPKEAVQVGSTFEFQPLPGSKTTTHVKVAALEPVAGVDCLKFEMQLPASIEGEVNKMVVWIDPKTGIYRKVQMDSSSSQDGLKVENHFTQDIKP